MNETFTRKVNTILQNIRKNFNAGIRNFNSVYYRDFIANFLNVVLRVCFKDVKRVLLFLLMTMNTILFINLNRYLSTIVKAIDSRNIFDQFRLTLVM